MLNNRDFVVPDDAVVLFGTSRCVGPSNGTTGSFEDNALILASLLTAVQLDLTIN